MGTQLTADDAKESLTSHVFAKGGELREKYGPKIGRNELIAILADRSVCRYPCEIAFDAGPLQEGEFVYPMARGELPEEGFTIFVHPFFETHPDRVPFMVLYQLVVVNYGEFVSPLDAETFGAAALGISKDEYYQILCGMAEEIGVTTPPASSGCGKSDCGCH